MRQLEHIVIRLLLGYVFVLLASFGLADTGSVRLKVFPDIAIADAKTEITVTAEIRDGSGSLAPNGTQVLFQTSLGYLRESAVSTVDGVARATLNPGGTPGVAKITASALSLSATASFELEFVASRNQLSKAREFIEVKAPGQMLFSQDLMILSASGVGRGVSIKYGDTVLTADDVQLDIARKEVKARRAKLRFGDTERSFDELLLDLENRKAVGITALESKVVTGIAPMGHGLVFTTKLQNRTTALEMKASGKVTPLPLGISPRELEFADISDSSSYVSAKTALIFPGREIQFHRAEVLVQGTRVLKLPLYQISLQPGAPTSFGEQVFSFNDSRIGVNYPHYLSLSPTDSSLLRFRTGERTGRSLSGSAGSFIDYELKWRRGDSQEGDLTLSGINRDDWSVDARQFLRLRDGSSVNGFVSMPGRRSVFGSVGISKPFEGFQASLNSSINRSLVGESFSGEQLSLVVETDPRRVEALGLTLYTGVTASDIHSRGFGAETNVRSYGARLRGQFSPINIDRATTMSSSFSVGQRWSNSGTGLALQGSASVNRQLGNFGRLGLNYDYAADDSLQSALAGGKHRLSGTMSYDAGRTNLSVFGSRMLDADWTSFYGDASYRVSGLYRFSAAYTLDQYLGASNLDYSLMLSYRIGLREIGLSWSNQTRRLGFQVLGTRF